MARLLVCIPLVLSFCGPLLAQTPAPTVTQTVHFTYGDTVRTYYLRVPALADTARRVPLVIDLHGYSNTAIGQSQMSGFRRRADADTFAIAWPQGVGNSWNTGETCCGTARERGLDDVDFLITVVRHIRAAHSKSIDGRRVYATGHSNGGAMVERLALEAGDVFAAVVDVSGFLDGQQPAWPAQGRLASRLHLHGLQDSTVHYAGDAKRISVDSALALWKSGLSCTGEPDTLILDSATHSLCRAYSDCREDSELALCAIAGVHMLYNNTPRIDLTIMAWEFLRHFELENPESVTGLRRPNITPITTLNQTYRVTTRRHDAAGRVKSSKPNARPHNPGLFPARP